jgi:hypothetical protein
VSRPIVEQLHFPEFKSAIDRAIVAGTRITPNERERWAQYVATHKIREANFQAYARGMFPDLQPLILDEGPPWGGYYMWSPVEEVVLRWRRPVTADPEQS